MLLATAWKSTDFTHFSNKNRKTWLDHFLHLMYSLDLDKRTSRWRSRKNCYWYNVCIDLANGIRNHSLGKFGGMKGSNIKVYFQWNCAHWLVEEFFEDQTGPKFFLGCPKLQSRFFQEDLISAFWSPKIYTFSHPLWEFR